VQLLEDVLHHVLGGAQVADQQQRQPDQPQVMGTEQLGNVWRRARARAIRRGARAADDIDLHV
jgi:hypothetical protein